MVHVLGTLVAAAHHNLFVVVQIAFGYLFNLLAHGGGEEERIAVFGHTGKNLVQTLREAHVEHLVSLVEHHVAHGVEACHAPVHQVDEAAWSGHDDLHTALDGMNLVLDGGAAVDSHDAHTLHVFREVLHVVGNLEAEFTGRTEHDGLRRLVVGVDALEHGNAECGSLARAGLCQGDDVVAVAE